ncbi:MAG: hypothetical protein ACOC6P_00150 [Candidatus Aminicenantaceae bacterium]
MKKYLGILFILLLLSSNAFSSDLNIYGMVKFFSSVYTSSNPEGTYFSHKKNEFALQRLETRLQIGGILSDKVSFSTRFDAFSRPDALFDSDSFPESSILGTPSQTEPFEVSMYEAYIRVSDFLFKGFDLTVGKQRIHWGTADKMNVVDNLNPIDFANFFTFDPDYFGERRPQTAVNMEFYLPKQIKFQLVWLPSRQISPLPAGISQILAPSPFEVEIDTEKSLLKKTNLGIRLSSFVFNMDIGLSYYHGNFHLPVLYGMTTQLFGNTRLYYKYPKKDILGLDLAGELFSVGFWAEAAYIEPENIKGFVAFPFLVNGNLSPMKQVFPLFESGYFQYVLGMDYTFGIGNGVYLNMQYLHGFFDEKDYSNKAEQMLGMQKGMFFGELEDYLIASAEYKMLNNDLKIEAGGMVEFTGDETAIAFMPAIEYRIWDYALLQAGAFLSSGDDQDTKFGVFKDDKLIYFSFKLNF